MADYFIWNRSMGGLLAALSYEVLSMLGFLRERYPKRQVAVVLHLAAVQ